MIENASSRVGKMEVTVTREGEKKVERKRESSACLLCLSNAVSCHLGVSAALCGEGILKNKVINVDFTKI